MIPDMIDLIFFPSFSIFSSYCIPFILLSLLPCCVSFRELCICLLESV